MQPNTPLSQQQCNNMATNIALTSNVSGTLFSLIGTTFNRTVTPLSANLLGDGPASGFNRPLPKTEKNTPLSQQQCNNMATNIALTSNVSGVLFKIIPTPDPSHTPLNQQQCNIMATNLALPSNVSGYFFTPLNQDQCNNMATSVTLTTHLGGTLLSLTGTPSSSPDDGAWPGTIKSKHPKE